MTKYAHWALTQQPLHLLLIIIVITAVTMQLPPQWSEGIRVFGILLILAVLLWGFFRFGQEARLYREELREHREEIVQMLARREAELVHMKDTAQSLAHETARIAASLSVETKQSFDNVARQVEASATAATRAYEEANHANKKIEALNERLLEQSRVTQEALRKDLAPVIEHGGQLDRIEHVAEESHTILKKVIPDGERTETT